MLVGNKVKVIYTIGGTKWTTFLELQGLVTDQAVMKALHDKLNLVIYNAAFCPL